MGGPTFEQLREQNDPGCVERERLEREAPAMKTRIAYLEAALREIKKRTEVYRDGVYEIADRALRKDLRERQMDDTESIERQKKVNEFASKLSDLCREHGFGIAGEPCIFEMEPEDLNHSYIVADDGRLVFY